MTVAVVYLIGPPYSFENYKRFIESYIGYSSGFGHKLVLLFNNLPDRHDANLFIKDISKIENLQFEVFHSKSLQDISAYRWIAQELKESHILFFNSHAEILFENWLIKFVNVFKSSTPGMVGATGTWQSHYSLVFQKNRWIWEKGKTIKENFDKYKLMIKAFFLWQIYFKPFPNPHLRTNAFMVDKKIFCSLKFNALTNKMLAYRMESGRNGFASQLAKKGLSIVMLGKNGEYYNMPEWPQSKIYYANNQENLLIGDNHTRLYANANDALRRQLSYLVWKDYNLK